MSLDWDRLPADMYVRKLVLREKSPYSPAQRLVCLAIADRMSQDQGRWVAFMGLPDIAKRTGYSVKTISRSIDALKNSSEPLFRIYLGGVTRGVPHSCYGFELVRNPRAFAEARDRTRTERAATADAILGRGGTRKRTLTAAQEDVRERLIEEKRKLGIGVGRGELSDDEYRRHKAESERAALKSLGLRGGTESPTKTNRAGDSLER